ncbi:hypothetical protein I0E51_15375 [Pseudomonas lalucatii]|nr:hypothetical protein [Pseudomonas lalucatii]
MTAAGLAADGAAQPLADSLLAQLGRQAVVGLSLVPRQGLDVARLAASLGQPRLRLQLEAGEAWIYPRLGLSVHSEDEQLRLLQVVPRRAASPLSRYSQRGHHCGRVPCNCLR